MIEQEKFMMKNPNPDPVNQLNENRQHTNQAAFQNKALDTISFIDLPRIQE